MDMMGFEKDQRIVRKYGNVPSSQEFSWTTTFHFRSKLERRWAAVLENMRIGGALLWWAHEPIRLDFEREKEGDPKEWTPDFLAVSADPVELVLYECKGLISGKDARKLFLTRVQFPEITTRYFVQASRSQKQKRLRSACLANSELIIAGPIFTKMGVK